MPDVPDFPPAPRSPRYRWDGRVRRFRSPRGTFVSAATVRGQLDNVLDGISAEMRGLSAQLRAGEITLAEWQTGMMAKIKETHITAAVAERGGFQQMTQADWGRVGRVVRDEYGYLRAFAADIASGKVPLDGRLDARARLYGQAGRATYHRLETLDEQRAGMTEERRVLNPADHCDDCVGYADRGWVPIGTLPPPGVGSVCRTNCKCTKEYRAEEAVLV